MKKFMFIVLFAMPFCKAADPDASWKESAAIKYPNGTFHEANINLSQGEITAIPESFGLSYVTDLNLSDSKIGEIHGPFLPWLESLNLANNPIRYIDPKIIKKFPKLKFLDLSGTKLSADNVSQLKQELPDLIIEEGVYLKPAKKG